MLRETFSTWEFALSKSVPIIEEPTSVLRLTRPITLIGLPWCGKNTQGSLLQERFQIPHVDFWSSRRSIIEWNHDVQEAITMSRNSHKKHLKYDIGFRKEYVHMLLERNKAQDVRDNIVLDGAIRDDIWLEAIQHILGDPYLVFFHISRNTSHDRTRKRNERITDRKSWARRWRIEAFNRNALPIINNFHQQNRVIHINAEWEIEDIHSRLLDRLSHEWILKWHTPVTSIPKRKIKKQEKVKDEKLKHLYFSWKKVLLRGINYLYGLLWVFTNISRTFWKRKHNKESW